jgi:2-amino-4-hydroxy-6-hydroxymethyldihydropteridine diphosphokinase
MPEKVFVTLGSNINAKNNLPSALTLLRADVPVARVSRVYESKPFESSGDKFLNAAVMFESDTPPGVIKFGLLRPIETLLGRVRTDDKNAPRTIDLDIALYGSTVLDDPSSQLLLPSPDILTHAYVALPLADLDPDFVHPVTGERLSQITERFANQSGVSVHSLTLI